jgi:two-component system OmpR family sensor kinase
MLGNSMRYLTYSLILVVLTATVGLGWLFDQFYEEYTNQKKSKDIDAISTLEKIGSDIALTLNNISSNNDRLKNKFIAQWSTENDYSLTLISIDDLPLPENLLVNFKQGKPLILETNEHVSLHYYLKINDEILILKTSLENVKKTETSLQYSLTFLFYFLLLMLFLIWVYPLLKQLQRLRKTAKLFGKGDLKQRININSISYIREIETEFNHMAQRIENLLNDVKLLSSAVSHDLRTPIARIRFGIDTLQEETDEKLRKQYEKKISDNVDEMTSLVESLLSYARIDQSMQDLEHEELNLKNIINDCIKNESEKNVKIEFISSDENYFYTGNKSTLLMLFNNVIQNAVNYCNSRVLIKLERDKQKIKICISDDGEGISIAQRELIFKPFNRGELNKTKSNYKGHGLGLAIVKRIVEWHKGDIIVTESSTLGGAKFIISLPEEN